MLSSGVQGLNMSIQYGNKQCGPPPTKCQKCKTIKCKQKCLKQYYKKCHKEWTPSTVLGAI